MVARGIGLVRGEVALLDGVIRVDLFKKLTFEQMINGKMKIPAQENSNDLRWKQALYVLEI